MTGHCPATGRSLASALWARPDVSGNPSQRADHARYDELIFLAAVSDFLPIRPIKQGIRWTGFYRPGVGIMNSGPRRVPAVQRWVIAL